MKIPQKRILVIINYLKRFTPVTVLAVLSILLVFIRTAKAQGTDISNFWPFPPAGSYMEYAEIPMPSPYPTLPPSRLRFDIEKYINACSSTNMPVFRIAQTNLNVETRRFMGRGQGASNFRLIIKWVGDHLHGFGLQKYEVMNEQLGSDPLVPRGNLGPHKELFGIMSETGYTTENLPSFYILPRYLEPNFYKDDYFETSDGTCENFQRRYEWAMDIRRLDETDLASGVGPGNLQVGDLQLRFIEHDSTTTANPSPTPPSPKIWTNREDWFLREGQGVIRIESAYNKYSYECVNNEHSNIACWSDPNLTADSPCNCWGRRIHPSKITDGLYLIQSYQPRKLSFIIKESGTTSYTVQRDDSFTIKETSSNYTGYLSEITRPDQIWKANQAGVDGLQDIWLENGEARIYVPPNYPPGTYTGQFRSWIWSKPADDITLEETTLEPLYPEWSDAITAKVVALQGDINTDGKVDINDFRLLISDFGKTASSPADLNGDDKVDIFDLNILIGNFGKVGS